jgi:hypothetical protein
MNISGRRATGILLLAISFLHSFFLIAQPNLNCSIRGQILDRQTQSPLPGATVTIVGSNPLTGTITSDNGTFVLTGLNVGQYELKISYLGYHTNITDPVSVMTGKESSIIVLLDENIMTVPEVEIKSEYRKNRAINRMATVGVRSFSVDETSRFAGSYNDPARMVASFAGVTSGIDNRNDIIIRGNSPMGVQWRIDDMEIPNPNHFAAVGTTGGPVTILNNNLVTNSDFMTGTFPAQYSNTSAGVFDLKMRSGNSTKREYWFGIGWNGLEFGTEGPITRKQNASYLFSYRYSILQLLGKLGISIGLVPDYHDINMKISFNAKKAGSFTLTAIGGKSYIELFDSREPSSDWLFPDYGEDIANGSNLGVLGIGHQIFFSPVLNWKTTLYCVASETFTRIDTFSNIHTSPALWAGERSYETKYSLASKMTSKVDPENALMAGVNLDYFNLGYRDSSMLRGSFVRHTGTKEKMWLARGFLQWQHFFEKWNFTAGINGLWLSLNRSVAVDPRLGIEWIVSGNQTITIGTGLYSQMQPKVIYFILTPDLQGNYRQNNLRLGLTRSFQSSMGYEIMISKDLRFKSEIYLQHLFNVPVNPAIPQYSLINQGHGFFLDRQYSDSLVNEGSGKNYGVELTLEKYFQKNLFFLFTASVFRSTYVGFDQTERRTAFDIGYSLNAAAGYEFIMGRRKWGVMSFGLKATWAGCNPYLPYDQNATVLAAEPLYDWEKAYQPVFPEYKRFALRFGIRRNLPGYTMDFALDLQYRTSFTNVALQRINPLTGEIRNFFSLSFFPMATWRLLF